MKKVLFNEGYDDFDSYFHLTVDRWYDVMEEDDEFYKIFCDMNFSRWFAKKLFSTKSQIRKQKLLKINGIF